MRKKKTGASRSDSVLPEKETESKPAFPCSSFSVPRERYRPYFVGTPGLPNTPAGDQKKEDE
ncbi:MAG: hypothetical protein WCT33_03270 [Patescibacteria group bacterium]